MILERKLLEFKCSLLKIKKLSDALDYPNFQECSILA